MTGNLRNEVLKLRTTRTPWLFLGIAQVLVFIGISGVYVSGADPYDPQTALTALAHVGLVSILSLVMGILGVAGEYRYKTITDTYLATPSRGKVVAAKVLVYSAFGAVLSIASTVTALITTLAWLKAKDVPMPASTGDLWQTAAGCVVWNICFAAVGVGVGALVRNLAGAVAGALLWIAVVEGLVAQLIGGNAKWLAFRSGVALEGLDSPSIAVLPQWGGGLMLVAYAGAFVAVALATSMRRDVT